MPHVRMPERAYTDTHCHLLPGMDDGAKDETETLAAAEGLLALGFSRVIATPHYYYYKETADAFLARRSAALLRAEAVLPEGFTVLPAAEVALERGISEKCELGKLAIPGTNYILLELPMRKYTSELAEELYDIRLKYRLVPVLAHVERYLRFYRDDDYNDLLSSGSMICQISFFAMNELGTRRFFRRLLSSGAPIVFGTDAHRADRRLKRAEKGIERLKKTVSPEDFEQLMTCEVLGI